jgi:hypothetical protein
MVILNVVMMENGSVFLGILLSADTFDVGCFASGNDVATE